MTFREDVLKHATEVELLRLFVTISFTSQKIKG